MIEACLCKLVQNIAMTGRQSFLPKTLRILIKNCVIFGGMRGEEIGGGVAGSLPKSKIESEQPRAKSQYVRCGCSSLCGNKKFFGIRKFFSHFLFCSGDCDDFVREVVTTLPNFFCTIGRYDQQDVEKCCIFAKIISEVFNRKD